jgi:hypothetical protein
MSNGQWKGMFDGALYGGKKAQTRICMTEIYEHLKSWDGHYADNYNLYILDTGLVNLQITWSIQG